MDSKKIIESLQLPTLSKTLIQIIEVEKKDSISFLDDIKKIVEKDPLLSAHVLKVANSPFYGFSQKVRTISHAIGLLGIRKIKNLAFSFSIFDFLKKLDYKASYGNMFNLILKKSLLISACCTILAKKADYLDTEELYLSGLLSEIGQIILFLHAPNTYSDIYSVIDKKIIPREQEKFGTDHLKLGVDFCEIYKLPSFFKTTVQNHYQMKDSGEGSKISFIANQVAELLLTEDEDEKTVIFKELENYTKRLLHLSLSEIEETIKQLPDIMEAFVADFPEMQKDLKKIIETGSSLIITLMKKEMEMIVLTRELTDSQKKLAKEKMFLSHMLNLSYFFSSLIPPAKTISSLFEYFENFINEFDLEFIYSPPDSEKYRLFQNKGDSEGTPFDIEPYTSLTRSRISNETVRLEKNELKMLGKSETEVALVFPVSYHHNFFGFLILVVDRKNYQAFDLEMSYVQILTNIIANSFQNYLSFEGMKNESTKKKLVTEELFKFDKKLKSSRETVIELQKAEIMGELLPVIFHKLKNKLTPILGYSQILLAKVKDDTVSERLKKIEKSANELTYQLNLLRDYFKTEKVTKEKNNINHIINHLKPFFEDIERRNDLQIILDLDYQVPDSFLNPGQIEALITNMVDNSVNSIKSKETKGGMIDIKTETTSDGYKLVVRDNGVGMKEENITRIWTPFYTSIPDQPGIGLTVCEKIIMNHNAAFTVRSQDGHYAEFEINFKQSEAEVEEKEALEENNIPQKPDYHGRILIVDDEAYLLDLMKEILLNEGSFDVLTTTSGKEAIRMIDGNFDLVISDIRMPEVNGMDIYDYLKSKQMESKVIMVTADPFAEDVALFLKKNRINYLKKPFELMKFKKIVLEKLS
jgi:HD-like signal output (HDOD) protein/signal transduction histidine kinase